MGNKIIKAESNAKTGSSKVVIQNKYGIFRGFSQCHPNDMETFSAYAGERYAETRAVAEYAKFRWKQEKIKLKTIKDLMKDIEYSCPEEKESSPLFRRVKLKLRDYSQSSEDWGNLYHFLKNSIDKQDKERVKILSRTK